MSLSFCILNYSRWIVNETGFGDECECARLRLAQNGWDDRECHEPFPDFLCQFSNGPDFVTASSSSEYFYTFSTIIQK